MAKPISITEPLDLSAFKRPMKGIPARVEAAISQGVVSTRDVPFSQAARLLELEGDGFQDAVIRNQDGMLVVCCLTDLPGNTPEMWDWWFGWHGVSSERYRLWHPEDHVWSAVSEDRRAFGDLRARYVGVDSYVDERIASPQVVKLTIGFRAPATFGLDQTRVDQVGTAVCARVGFRGTPLNTGRLIHLIRRSPTGAQMISRFWLGDIELHVPVVGGLLAPLLNRRTRRLKLLPDEIGLNLLRHCSKEMNHLAGLMPDLYRKFALS